MGIGQDLALKYHMHCYFIAICLPIYCLSFGVLLLFLCLFEASSCDLLRDWFALGLLFLCYFFAISLLFGCCLVAVWLLFGCCLVAVWLLFGCYFFGKIATKGQRTGLESTNMMPVIPLLIP